MLNSIEELEALFTPTPLVGKMFQALDIPGHQEQIFSAPIDTDRVFSSWEIAHQYLAKTGRWPIIVEPWGDLEEYVNRFPYELEQLGKESPRQLIDSAREVDLSSLLQAWLTEQEEPAQDWWQTEVPLTRQSFGLTPPAEVYAHCKTHWELDRALLEWEEEQEASFDTTKMHIHIDWFEASKPHLFLLPTPHSWATLAYVPWYEQRTVPTMALLKDWEERFGAQLVCHYSTMLQFRVSKPPQNLEEAWTLAQEQVCVAPCTTALPGVSLRDHARALVGHGSWFLHERP